MRAAWTVLLVAGLTLPPWSPGVAQRLDRAAYAAPPTGADASVSHPTASDKRKPSFVKHVGVGAGIGALIGLVGAAAFTICDSPRAVLCGQYEVIPMLTSIGALGGAYAGALVYIVRRLFVNDSPSPGLPSPTT